MPAPEAFEHRLTHSTCMHVCTPGKHLHLAHRYWKFSAPMCSCGLSPQIARFLWCMIRLDLCHGASVRRLAAYISEYASNSRGSHKNAGFSLVGWEPARVHDIVRKILLGWEVHSTEGVEHRDHPVVLSHVLSRQSTYVFAVKRPG